MNNGPAPPPGGKRAPPPPGPATAAPEANPFAQVSNTALNLVVDSKMAEEEPPGRSQEPMRALTPHELEQLLPSPAWKLRARRLVRWSWPVLTLGVSGNRDLREVMKEIVEATVPE